MNTRIFLFLLGLQGLLVCIDGSKANSTHNTRVSHASAKDSEQLHPAANGPIFVNRQRMKRSQVSVRSVKASLRLSCEARGKGLIAYTWFKSDGKIKAKQLNFSAPILKIRKLLATDGGNYTCVARDGARSISFTFQVIVVIVKGKELALDQKVSKMVGESAKLICKVPQNVEQVVWRKDSKRLKTERRFRIKRGGKFLRITKLQSSDSGLYVCMSATTDKVYRKVFIEIRSPHAKDRGIHGTYPPDGPVFVHSLKMKRSQYNVRPVGSTLRLPCDARGKGIIVYRWYKNGERLKERRLDSKMNASAPVLKLKDLVLSDVGNYTCVASDKSKNISFNFEVTVLEKVRSKPILQSGHPRNKTAIVGQNVTFECYELISGTLPDFRWVHWKTLPPPRVIDEATTSGNISGSYRATLISPKYYESIQMKGTRQKYHYGVRLHLYNVTKESQGFYSCIVSNHIGTDHLIAHLTVRTYRDNYLLEKSALLNNHAQSSGSAHGFENQSVVMIVLVAVVVFVVVAVGVVCFLFYIYRLKTRKEKKGKDIEDPKYTNAEQLPFVDSNSNSKPNGTVMISRGRLLSSVSGTSTEPLLRGQHPSLRSQMSDVYSIRSGQSLPQTPEFGEVFGVPVDEDWEIERSQLILGEVLGEGAFGVVIKAEGIGLRGCPPCCTVAVKRLKGDATDNELLDLLSEVETMKHIGEHRNIIKLIGCCSVDGPLFVVVEYALHGNLRQFLRNNRPIAEYIDGEIIRPKQLLSAQNLVSFALQIAKGMEYLASRKCIHRDLAARNVLVAEGKVMKIADFGLSRSTKEEEYYRKTTDGRLPVKWLAIEALIDRVFTTQSDAWAFGVLLWEIFTLGGSPYPGIPVQQLFDLLKSGYRMDKPHGCPESIYDMMLKCWLELPDKRPTFTILVHELEDILEDLTSAEYVEVVGHSMPSLNGTDRSDDGDLQLTEPALMNCMSSSYQGLSEVESGSPMSNFSEGSLNLSEVPAGDLAALGDAMMESDL